MFLCDVIHPHGVTFHCNDVTPVRGLVEAILPLSKKLRFFSEIYVKNITVSEA